jgi:L-amino acid N-acyltransferase YncA
VLLTANEAQPGKWRWLGLHAGDARAILGAVIQEKMTTLVLRDGSRVAVRPIRGSDRAAISSAFDRLSEESRYRRFLSAIDQLTASQLAYLTEVDHHGHEALVAYEAETGAGVAVARWVVTQPGVAEIALAVTDDWQRRGLGALLSARLLELARREGVHQVRASVLAENAGAVGLLKAAGFRRVGFDGAMHEYALVLPA